MRKYVLPLAALLLMAAGCAEKAPSKEGVQAAVGKLLPVKFEILEVSRTPQFKSLYQVTIMVDRQPVVFYVDKEAKYAFSGNIIEIDSKKNLTQEAQKKYLPKQ